MKKHKLKKKWRGRDNLELKVKEFRILRSWLDYDSTHKPVLRYSVVLRNAIVHLVSSPTVDIELLRGVKWLLDDLKELHQEIEEKMEQGNNQL